jgi:hypothetical protein
MKTLEEHTSIPESRKTELLCVPGGAQAMIGLENAATEIARAAQKLQISYKSLVCKIKQIVPCDAKETERGEI